jgi:hypothetical protein
MYVAAAAIAVMALAGVGAWHLIAPRKELAPAAPNLPVAKSTPSSPSKTPATATAIARVSPGVAPSSPSAILNPPSSPIPVAPTLDRQIAITDLTQEERRGPRGEDIVIGTIGLTSRSDVEKNNVQIGVFFFDLTPANEMRPTRAQVTYRWLTPVRDWSDPEPKYLAATYFKPRPFRRPPDELRYGGFIVRVYSDGKLQDERSQPETLLAALRSNAAPSSPSATLNPPSSPESRPPSPPRPSQSSQPSTLNSQPPTSRRSLGEGGSEESLPNGIPIPGKPGFVQSPYDPKFIIDVRGFPPGTLVNDPNTNKPFRVP